MFDQAGLSLENGEETHVFKRITSIPPSNSFY